MSIKDKLISFENEASRHCTVTMHDGRELYVENCRCIKECDDNFITLSVAGADIRVTGAPLTLESFGVNGVKISGKIHSLTLEEH